MLFLSVNIGHNIVKRTTYGYKVGNFAAFCNMRHNSCHIHARRVELKSPRGVCTTAFYVNAKRATAGLYLLEPVAFGQLYYLWHFGTYLALGSMSCSIMRND